MADAPAKSAGLDAASMKLNFTQYHDAIPAVYIFTASQGRGYVAVAADDTSTPLLGYSPDGMIPANREEMPDGLGYWLETLACEVAWNASHRSDRIVSRANADRQPVAPLCATRWNQSSPFNDMAPLVGSSRCVTGCVATAMAQVLKYYEYPATGTGTYSYTYTNEQNADKTLSFDYGATTFDWENMLDVYGDNATQAEKNAVATLMLACGVGVQMNYGTGESGAVSARMLRALVENFGYDKGVRYLSRVNYTLAQWEDLVYQNLIEFGPVLYDGRNTGSGHQFICDGYQGGYFHFNWGWGGMSDGYFLLSALDPGAQGIGGSTSGYNMSQHIVTNLSYGGKSTTYWEQLDWMSAFTPGVSSCALGSSVSFSGSMGNNSTLALNGTNVGVRFTPADGSDAFYVSSGTIGEVPPGSYYPSITLPVRIPTGLAEGEYTLVPAFINSEGETVDMGVPAALSNSVTMTVEGSTAYFTDAPAATLEVSDFQLDSGLYVGTPFKVNATLTNVSETKEYFGNLVVGIVQNGDLKAWGNAKTVTVEAGDNCELQYVSSLTMRKSGFTITAGQYQLGIFEYNSSEGTYKQISDLIDVELKAKSTPSISVTDLKIENGQNLNSIKGTATVKCTSGYFAGYLTCYIFPATGGYSIAGFSSDFLSVSAAASGAMEMAPAVGETTAYFNMPFSIGEENTYYLAAIFYNGSQVSNGITFKTGTLTTGIEEVGSSASEVVRTEYISLSGVSLGETKPAAGLYIVRRVHADGSVTTARELVR